MKISAKTDYACKALLELSIHWPSTTPLQIDTIAKRQNIPMKFLTQILLNLKQLGLVTSIRGKSGGYLLSRAPKDIQLSDLVIGLGDLGIVESERKRNLKGEHVMDSIWQDIEEDVVSSMQKVNFEIIRERSRSQANVMMYGI